MAILVECPICHRKLSTKKKTCKCGEHLDQAKRSSRVKFHVVQRVQGKQIWKLADDPFSIESARACEGKRKSQNAEGRILDILPEARITFDELIKWYLELSSVKELASCKRIEYALNNFKGVFGDRLLGSIQPAELEEYQNKRAKEHRAPATIDMEFSLVRTMITKAFDNDMISGDALRAFRKVKRRLKKGANARQRTINIDEYNRLLANSARHLKDIIIVAFNTGMRRGELRKLQWSHIDKKADMIRLPADLTKEGRPKVIPINHYVKDVLESIPRAINHDYVFTYNGKPIAHKDSLKKSFMTACKNAKIPHGRKTPLGITFHDTRRTLKTHMLKAGIDKIHRDLILGHAVTGMDAHYIAPSEDDLKKAMDRYTEWLDMLLLGIVRKRKSI